MENDPWTVSIDEFGTWLCEHTDEAGHTALSTRLNAANGKVDSFSTRPDRLHCPDCGTLWRVWESRGVAKYYIEYPCQPIPPPSGPPVSNFCRARWKDIDHIVAAVSQAFPDLTVSQHQYVHPPDDEGIWWCGLPGLRDNVQIESWNGMGPLSVETDDPYCANSGEAATAEEAIDLITERIKRYRVTMGNG